MLLETRRNIFVTSLIFGSYLIFPQASYAIGVTVLNTSAFTLDTATPSGTFEASALSTGILNTTAADTGAERTAAIQQGPPGLGGFGGFFTSTFLAVGGTSSQTIGASGKRNNTTVNSAIFTLTGTDLTQDLKISLDYIFSGYIGNGVSAPSDFNVQLVDVALGIQTDFFSPVSLNTLSSGATLGRWNTLQGIGTTGVISGALLTANYTATTQTFYVALTVNEPSAITTNTVAGFQNVSIETIPFDFDPSAGIAILGAGFGLNKLRKNLKAKKETKV